MAKPTKKGEDPFDIPFAGIPNARNNGSKDQRYINVVIEKLQNQTMGTEKTYILKRSGLASSTRPPSANATARGSYYWAASGKLYTVFDNKIYADTTDLGVTLTASSGRCWFDETPASGFSGGLRLLVSDGTKLYSIQTDNTVTTVSTSSDADFPTGNLGPVIYFDGYIFLAKSNGQIWNSDVDSITSWASTNYIIPEMYGDDLECIVKQKDQIIAMGKGSIEFFYDNANPTASPLQRIDQNALQIGCATKNSVATIADTCCFVAQSTIGGYSVWMIQGLQKIGAISTPAIERILNQEFGDISNCSAFLVSDKGHLLYVLNLNTANKTIVYDLDTEHWYEWANTSDVKFNCYSATEKNGYAYLQDTTNGRVYQMTPTTYQDNGSNFTVTVQTDKMDFGENAVKRQYRLDVAGDTTTGNLAVSWADDDYTTFSTARNIDMSKVSKSLTQLGSFRRRAYKFTYTDNYDLRLEYFSNHVALNGQSWNSQ